MSNAFEQHHQLGQKFDMPHTDKAPGRGIDVDFSNDVRHLVGAFEPMPKNAQDALRFDERRTARENVIGKDAVDCLAKASNVLRAAVESGTTGSPLDVARQTLSRMKAANLEHDTKGARAFFRQRSSELAELGRLAPNDFEKAEKELMVRGLDEQEGELVKKYFQIAKAMLQEVRNREKAGADTLEDYHVLRQELYPAMELMAAAETKEVRPAFEGLKKDTLDYLRAMAPDLDGDLLARRAESIAFRVKTSLDSAQKWERADGAYNALGDDVRVPRNKRHDETVLRHEILHGLSRGEHGPKMGFSDPELDDKAQHFLQEALIEELSQFANSKDENGAYHDERFLFADLRRSPSGSEEIPLAAFVKALFGRDKSLRHALNEHGLTDAQADNVLKLANHHGFNLDYARNMGREKTD